MPDIRALFMLFVAAVVLFGFASSIFYAGLWKEATADFPEVITYFVSAVNSTLAANLGAVLGIGSMVGFRTPTTASQWVQWIAAGVYVASLVVAAVFWGLKRFTDDPAMVVAILPEMTKNGIGIFIAILAAVLGVQTIRQWRTP